jgi:hypothetical protein
MNCRFPLLAVAITLGLAQFPAAGQVPAQQTPPPSADPYANNPDAGKLQFPLAAPAGKDSRPIAPASGTAATPEPAKPARYLRGVR